MPTNLMEKVIDAFQNLFEIGKNITDPKQYDIKEFKRVRYQLEAAQEYIFVDEKSGPYKKSNDREIENLKVHFRKRAFDSA